jgi:hypothetical protein
MAGRNISVSHVALGSTRIQGTCGVSGQAIGTAAALCCKYGINPREILSQYIGELQQALLKDDAYIIGIKNEDPLDKARSAKVSASSMWETDADYSPGNVINGVSRSVGDFPNMWASNPSQPMPQWLQLDLGNPVHVNFVQVAYDTNLNQKIAFAKETVRDYEVQALIEGDWFTIAKVEGNFQRLRRHKFETLMTESIRIVIHATNGCPSARIFEVRIYEQ